MIAMGFETGAPMSDSAIARYIQDEKDRWSVLIKDKNIHLEN